MLDKLLEEVDLKCQGHLVPEHVVLDVKSRITDWMHSGGVSTDRYIENQFRVLDRFISYKIHRAES